MYCRRSAQFRFLSLLLGGVMWLLPFLAPPLCAQPQLQDLPYGPDPRQKLDVYLPTDTQNAPVIVLVHGGGWRFGDKSNEAVWQDKAAHWTALGVMVVAVNYRLVPQVTPLDQAQDVARALAYVQANAAGWGGAGDHVVLMGHSAGGHLAALISADPALAKTLGAQDWLATVVLDTAILDTHAVMTSAPSVLYDQAFGSDPRFWAQVSPAARLSALAPPMLLVCSTRRALPCPQADALAARLTALGGLARILPVDMSHRSVNEALGLHPDYTAQVDAFLRDIGLWGQP
ncbi:alpha/beta hydrolase [Thalassovita sp.]|uniref:alpha/beta hydrolase n=1 Tax=Thalassovita sp. TaxID=1979401 RepID=UPI0029DE868D|nr:alpha/beta hydrolase [Thalassovita sp.]